MTVKLKAVNLPTNDLNVDPAYQRTVKRRQVKRVLNNYNEIAFGRILVGQRKGGDYWIVDGQQRWTAAIEMNMETVPCLVFESAGRKHEAQVFKDVNGGRTGMTAMELFRAVLEAKDQEALAIQANVEECGFSIGLGGSGSTTAISAVNALIEVYKKGGSEMLRKVLTVTKVTWPGERAAINGLTLRGLCQFFKEFEGRYSESRLIKKLKVESPLDLLRYVADATKFAGGGVRPKLFMRAVLNRYNSGLRTGRLVEGETPVEGPPKPEDE